MKDFKLVDRFSGYINKRDVTNVGSTFLVDGSQNTFINDGEKIATRPGFTLFGVANSALTPIESAFTWNTSTGTELPLRSYDDEFEFFESATETWTRIEDGFTAVGFDYATWWDDGEKLDLLVFVNGDSSLRAWSGGVATVSSATATTITKTGTETWGEARFFTTGDKVITIDGTDFTYTGGEDSTTLTGITPTAVGVSANEIAVQKPITTANTPAAGSDNDIIAVLKNQLYVADNNQRLVSISTVTDYKDYSSANTPRQPGDSEILTLDDRPRAMTPQEEDMYISAGNDQWYQTRFTTSDDLLGETLTIERLKTGPQQGALSQRSSSKIKNDVIFATNEPTIDTLGRITNVETPQSTPLSDPIKIEVEGLDVTIPPDIIYHKNKIYFAYPSSSTVLVFDVQRQLWYPPWIMPIRSWSIFEGDLYGHSSRVAESYKMLDGFNDNGAPYEAVATFAYRNFGRRANKKDYDEYYSEGYISSNTDLTLTQRYDFKGFETVREETIAGSDESILVSSVQDVSLGKNPLGAEPLGSTTQDISDLPKFRIIHTGIKIDFYEQQTEYSSNQTDAQWEILAHGPNAIFSKADNQAIKR